MNHTLPIRVVINCCEDSKNFVKIDILLSEGATVKQIAKVLTMQCENYICVKFNPAISCMWWSPWKSTIYFPAIGFRWNIFPVKTNALHGVSCSHAIKMTNKMWKSGNYMKSLASIIRNFLEKYSIIKFKWNAYKLIIWKLVFKKSGNVCRPTQFL